MADAAIERLSQEIAGLRTDVQALTQGLVLSQETQATHTEMLRELLQMVAQEPGPSPLADALAQILVVLTRNQEAVERLGEQLAELPEQLGDQIVQAFERAVGVARRPGSA
jgi:thioredoxin-like negative regulator of GroEL